MSASNSCAPLATSSNRPRSGRRVNWMGFVAGLLALGVLVAGGCRGEPPAGDGGLRFEEVAERVGLARTGPSYAAAAADFDGDGWPDLAVSEHRRVRLYRNDEGGGFTALPREDFSQPGDTHGVTWLDWNDDGLPDLYVSRGAYRGRGERLNRLHVNRDGARFEAAEVPAVLDNARGRGRSATPWDLNGDGRLDLMILNFLAEGRPQRLALSGVDGYRDAAEELGWAGLDANAVTAFRLGGETAFVLSGNGADPGRILRRDEHGRFVDVTRQAGIELEPGMAVTAVAVGDVDNDGDDDLYYVHAAGEAQGARAEAGRVSFFYARRHRADPAGFVVRADGGFHLEVWAEDRDEHAHLHLGPDARVAPEPRVRVADPAEFPAGAPDLEDAPTGAYFWRAEGGEFELRYVGGSGRPRAVSGSLAPDEGGVELVRQYGNWELDAVAPNRLWVNQGGTFRAVDAAADPEGGQDARFVDFDNDGDLDLYLVNGHHKLRNPPNSLYENRGGLEFADVTDSAGVAGSSRGRGATVTVLDHDRDGRMDFLVGNGYGPPPRNREGPRQFFRNTSPSGNWLRVELRATSSNPMSLGALVTVTADGLRQQRFVGTATGTLATSWLPLHFGLGDAGRAEVAVRWPSGARVTRAVEANTRVTLREPVNGDEQP